MGLSAMDSPIFMSGIFDRYSVFEQKLTCASYRPRKSRMISKRIIAPIAE
jgi:hypothetical protein